MDYIDFHVRRIADDLRRAGVSIPGNVFTPDVVNELPQETEFTIARVTNLRSTSHTGSEITVTTQL